MLDVLARLIERGLENESDDLVRLQSELVEKYLFPLAENLTA